jgi:hypothetical protein
MPRRSPHAETGRYLTEVADPSGTAQFDESVFIGTRSLFFPTQAHRQSCLRGSINLPFIANEAPSAQIFICSFRFSNRQA